MPKYPGTFHISKSFEVVDAALDNAMPRMDGFEYKRVPITSGSVVYILIDSQWGDLAKIKLTKTDHNYSDVHFPDFNCPEPNKPEWWKDENLKAQYERIDAEIQKRYEDIIGLIQSQMFFDFSIFDQYKQTEGKQETTPTLTTSAANDAMSTAKQVDEEQNDTHQATTKQRSARLIALGLIVLEVLIALATNVASSTVPKDWEPYLWLSWPLLGVLVILTLLLVFRQNGTSETHSA